MNYDIISATKSDLDFVLSLNQDSLPAVSHLDSKKVDHFLQISSYFKILTVEDNPVGLLIGLMPGKAYESENYIWVNQKYTSFIYVDRIIIDAKYRSKGLGVYFYNHLLKSMQFKVENILCEVNIRPYNKQSIKFHKKYGFEIIDKQDTENGNKRVAYMRYKVK